MVKKVEGLFYRDGEPISVEVRGDKIWQIKRLEKFGERHKEKIFIAPGFIDIQVNGYVSVGFSSDDLTVEGIRKLTQALWKVGVTSYLPTVISSSAERLKKNFHILAQSTADSEIGLSVPGFHLEGPYISAENGYRGAHNKKWVRLPDWREFSALNKIAQQKILLVTVAPELDGAIDFIRQCSQHDVVVAIGHHHASADKIKSAVDNGAALATHLGNACANMIHRHDNILWPQLADDRLMISIIADGFHLRPDEVNVFFKVKHPERVVLISDVTRFAGMPPGRYLWNKKEIEVTAEGTILNVGENNLAGACFPVSHGINNMLKFTDCSLKDAVDMVTKNSARLLSLVDRGEIKTGKRADLVLFRFAENKIIVEKTIVAGREVYSRD